MTLPASRTGSNVYDRIHYYQEALRELAWHGSWAAPGYMTPEGVVVFHTASNQLFKVTIEKDESPKGANGN